MTSTRTVPDFVGWGFAFLIILFLGWFGFAMFNKQDANPLQPAGVRGAASSEVPEKARTIIFECSGITGTREATVTTQKTLFGRIHKLEFDYRKMGLGGNSVRLWIQAFTSDKDYNWDKVEVSSLVWVPSEMNTKGGSKFNGHLTADQFQSFHKTKDGRWEDDKSESSVEYPIRLDEITQLLDCARAKILSEDASKVKPADSSR